MSAAAVTVWKRHRFALAFVILIVAVFFAPSLATQKVFTFRDHADYFQPLRYYTSIQLESFQLPYWNPYSQSGEPWLANPQTGVFYPPTWLFALLPFATAYMAYLAFHVALLGCGAYLLFARQVRPGAALVGAVALMFCGPVMSLLDVSNNLASFAWVPLVLWAAMARVRPQVAALLLALAFLAGEPFFAAVAALLYTIVAFTTERPAEAASRVAIAGAGALGLAAVQLLPFLEMLRGSDRAAGLRPEEIFAESMRLGDWLRLAVPPKFDLPDQPWQVNLSQHFLPVIYVGTLVVALAIIGVASGLRRAPRGSSPPTDAVSHRRSLTGWGLLLLASMIVAAGKHLPVTAAIFTHLPLTLFRYPSRVVAFGALAIAALAAAGWDRIRPDRRWVDLILLMVILVDVVAQEKSLFRTEPFVAGHVSYPLAVGRSAKVARITTKRLTNRSAWMAGYLNLYQRRFDAGTAAPVAARGYTRLYETAIGSRRADLLDFLGVGFLLCDRPVEGMPAVAKSGPVTVYENRNALPAATFWSAIRGNATAEDALNMTVLRRRAGVLDVSPLDSELPTSTARLVTAASWVAVSSRHARVVLEAPADGVVMITQQDHPAWRVYVDGVEGKKLLAGGVFRAVAVKKGRHEVVWMYKSRSLHTGAAMTLVTSLLLLTSRFVKRSAAQKFSS